MAKTEPALITMAKLGTPSEKLLREQIMVRNLLMDNMVGQLYHNMVAEEILVLHQMLDRIEKTKTLLLRQNA